MGTFLERKVPISLHPLPSKELKLNYNNIFKLQYNDYNIRLTG